MREAVQSLYPAHIRERILKAEKALIETGFDALIIYSGTPFRYYADDQDAPFRPFPHFAHWTPLRESHNFLLIRPRTKPVLVRLTPDDYWHEQVSIHDSFWLSEFECIEVSAPEAAWKEIQSRLSKSHARAAYIGDSPQQARAQGIEEGAVNPPQLLAFLDTQRSFKTEYEIACLVEANRIAAEGHRAAKDVFLAGGSELDIHQSYMKAVGCLERELPYETIVALNEKGAILHYQEKRKDTKRGMSLLLDAGADCNGYASDITRTCARDEADSVFKELLLEAEKVQQELCALARPGLSFKDFQHETHLKIGDLLHTLGVLKLNGRDAVSLGITKAFFPHGVGHLLGLQVHDVGHPKRVHEKEGEHMPEEENLRNKNIIEPRQVFTIEPGIYFIDMLLRPHRSGATSVHFNWPLIDRLAPYGGVRIEDDVLAMESGIRNLTREQL